MDPQASKMLKSVHQFIAIDLLLVGIGPERDEEVLHETLTRIAEIAEIDAKNIPDVLDWIEQVYLKIPRRSREEIAQKSREETPQRSREKTPQRSSEETPQRPREEIPQRSKEKSKDVKSSTICLPEQLCLFEKEKDLHEADHQDRLHFCTEEATALSSRIFSSLSSARPDRRLNWINLKCLAIARIETNKLQQLLKEAINLDTLQIFTLEFSCDNEKTKPANVSKIMLAKRKSAKNKSAKIQSAKPVKIKLANLRTFRVRTLEGRGEIKLKTPELTRFELSDKQDHGQVIELMYPMKLTSIGVKEYQPWMSLFKNLKCLWCDGELPENVLSNFTELKRLEYPLWKGPVSDLALPHEFSPRKERILSILREKQRLKRTDLEIVFYNIPLKDEQQLDCFEELSDFLVKNLPTGHRWDCLNTVLYDPDAVPLGDDLHFVNEVTVKGVVDDRRKLIGFLATLDNLVRLTTVDAKLDSNFYRKLADVAMFCKLEIVHTGKPIDLCKMADFDFLLQFDDLVEFRTDLPLSLKTIEKLLSQFTEFFIFCEFKGQEVSVRRVDEQFAFAAGDEEGSFDTLQALIEQLDKM